MKSYDRYDWVNIAAGGIARGKERERVWFELMDHIEDHAEALLSTGLSNEEALARAVDAMGDPHAVRQQLRRVHRPILTWMLRVLTPCLWLLLVIWLGYVWAVQPFSKEPECMMDEITATDFSLEELMDTTRPKIDLLGGQTIEIPYRRSRDISRQAKVSNLVFTFSRYTLTYMPQMFEGEQWLAAFQMELTREHFWQERPFAQGSFSAVTDNGHTVTQDLAMNIWNTCQIREHDRCVHGLMLWLPEDCRWIDLTYTDPENTFTLRIDVEGGTIYEAPAA